MGEIINPSFSSLSLLSFLGVGTVMLCIYYSYTVIPGRGWITGSCTLHISFLLARYFCFD